MNRLDRTRMAADALRLKYRLPSEHASQVITVNGLGVFNPEEDDAQALIVVRELRLSLSCAVDGVWTVKYKQPFGDRETEASNTDLNKAILQCAAQINRKP